MPEGPYTDQDVQQVTTEHYFVVSPTAYGRESCACGWYRDGWDAPSFEVHLASRLGLPLPEPECPSLCGDHHWLDRPESDTHECLICGAEGSGPAPADVVIPPACACHDNPGPFGPCPRHNPPGQPTPEPGPHQPPTRGGVR